MMVPTHFVSCVLNSALICVIIIYILIVIIYTIITINILYSMVHRQQVFHFTSKETPRSANELYVNFFTGFLYFRTQKDIVSAPSTGR